MPRKQPPKNSTWVSLTREFVKEWPEVLEGLHFTNMPVKYLMFVNIILKNNVTIHYDIKKELKIKKQERIAKFLKDTIEKNYLKIKKKNDNKSGALMMRTGLIKVIIEVRNQLIMLFLLILVIVSAVFVIETTHQTRQMFAEMQRQQSRSWLLEEDWGRLLLEQSTWAAHHRVERIASTELDMLVPVFSEIILVQP